MLKNIHPVMTGTLLDALRDLEPGDWLAITNDGPTASRAAARVLGVDTDFEGAASAIISVLPVHTEDEAPLHFWVQDSENDDNWDAVFAVTGLVRDGERRAVVSRQISSEAAREAVATAALVVHLPDARPHATFLVRVGGQLPAESSTRTDFTCAQA